MPVDVESSSIGKGICEESPDPLVSSPPLIPESAPAASPPPDAPVALLVAAEGDDHTLGLSLAELTLREAGWLTRWSGRRTPRPALASFMRESEVQLLAVSASASSSDRHALGEYAAWLGDVCEEYGAALVLGGSGAWPDELPYGARLGSYTELSEHARALAAR